MYGYESWTVKKAEHRKIDAFELWWCRRLLRVPWTARRSNQSILKEISLEYSVEGRMLKLKLPILWPPDVKSWLIGKDPDAGRDWGQEEKGTTEDEMAWMASPTQWTWVWVSSRSWWWTGRPGVLWFMGSQSRTWLSNWTELKVPTGFSVLCGHRFSKFEQRKYLKFWLCSLNQMPSWSTRFLHTVLSLLQKSLFLLKQHPW